MLELLDESLLGAVYGGIELRDTILLYYQI